MYSFREIWDALMHSSTNADALPMGVNVPLGKTGFHTLRPLVAHLPHLQPLLDEVQIFAQLACQTAIPALDFRHFAAFERTGQRSDYEIPYFERRGRMLALTLQLLLETTGDAAGEEHTQRCTAALADLVWEICNEYTWCLPACLPGGNYADTVADRLEPDKQVDLFAAETAHALAEMLILVGDRLHPWLAYRVRSEVERRVFQPLFTNPIPMDWESRRDNWAAVCGGAVGMAALLLVTDQRRLAGMLTRMLGSMRCFLEGYGEDGGCAEGIGYWFYGFGFYVYFAQMLAVRTEGKVDLLTAPAVAAQVAAIASFPAVMAFSNGKMANYADVGIVDWHSGLLCHLQTHLGVAIPPLSSLPGLKADGSYRWAHVTRNLLWSTEGQMKQSQQSQLLGGHLLPDLAVVVDRRRVHGQLLAFSAKGGHNAEAHNHNDLGHFIIHAAGEDLLCDLGTAAYTKDTFSARRYEGLTYSSQGHSVPLIADQAQSPGRESAAALLYCHWQGEQLQLALDLTSAYPQAGLQRFYRTFAWNWLADEEGQRHMLPALPSGQPSASLVLVDTYQFHETGVEVVEQFVSWHQPVVHSSGCVWRAGQAEVELTWDAACYDAQVLTDWMQRPDGTQRQIYRLQLRVLARQREWIVRFRFIVRCEQS